MFKKLLNIYKSKKEIFNYLIFGVLTTLINLLTYFLLTNLFFDAKDALQLQIVNIIAWVVSVIFAYCTNRKYVFNSTNDNKIKEISDFFLARLATLFMDMIIMFVGVNVLGVNDGIVKIISQVVVIVSNYILSKIFVFKKRIKDELLL